MSFDNKVEMWNYFISSDKYLVFLSQDNQAIIIDTPISLVLMPKPEWPNAYYYQVNWGDSYSSTDYLDNLKLCPILDAEKEYATINRGYNADTDR